MQIFDNPKDASRFIHSFEGELIIKLSGDMICNGEKVAEYHPDAEKCGFRRNK
jgi:hypothetical protein